MKYTFDEWFVVALARTITDGEVTFHGFASPCAQVAMHLAKRSFAPNMMLVEGAMYAVNPTPPFHSPPPETMRRSNRERSTPCVSRSSSTRRCAVISTGCFCPASRSTATETPT